MAIAETKKRPKLLILTCGGTIAMEVDEVRRVAMKSGSPIKIYDVEPRLEKIVDVESRFIANIDSTDASTALWEKLVSEIEGSYDDFDGFIITFGTNTLGYCSSALSFALAEIGKPVILTGSQVPAGEIHSDGRLNLINSCLVAISDIAGVYVVFGSRIINGTRAKKVNERDYDSFQGFLTGAAGTIGVHVSIGENTNRRHNKPFKAKNGFSAEVASLTLFPDMSPDIFTTLMDSGKKGFIIRAFGSGDIPRNLFPALAQAQSRGIPIVVTTQAPFGRASMDLNEIGLEALQYGVIPAFDMSIESMTTKMMWLLAQKIPFDSFREEMHRSLAGEINL